MKKKIMKLLWSGFLSVMLVMGLAGIMPMEKVEASYDYRLLAVPYYPQKIDRDCGISSVCMVEAYALGVDASCYDAVYEGVMLANGGTSLDPTVGALSNGKYKDVSKDLTTIYNNLVKGNPVLIYRKSASGGEHWSVIVGYNGSTTTLEKSGFIVYNTRHGQAVGVPSIDNLSNWLSGYTWSYAKVRNTGALSNITTNVETLTLENFRYLVNKKNGEGIAAMGLVISDGSIRSVEAGVKTAGGRVVFNGTAAPNSKYYGLMNLDGNMKFSGLAAGSYIYYVKALDSNGAELNVEKSFTVSGAATSVRLETVQGSGGTPINSEFPLVDGGIYKIRNVNSGKIIDIPGGTSENGSPVWQWDDGGVAHEFVAVKKDDGYIFKSVQTGYVLDIKDGSAATGVALTQYTFNDSAAQHFKVVGRGNGQYSIHPACSNLALDVYGSSLKNGEAIKQYAYHGRGNQLWTFEYIDRTSPDISNVQISEQDAFGYKVTCTVQDYGGVAKVCFPTWTDANGQDDLCANWQETTIGSSDGGNTFSYRVNIRDHNNEGGKYITHIYAYDNAGNYGFYEVTVNVRCNPSVDEWFTDVPQGAWYVSAVQYVYDNGIMTGKTATNFAPNANLTRAEFATVLYSQAGKPTVTYRSVFQDVEQGAWYSSPVLWAYDNGIVSGYANGYFGTSDKITREQLALMMYKYAQTAGYDTTSDAAILDSFSDKAAISSWARGAIQWAASHGIMSGKGTGADGRPVLDPKGNATRAECAAMIKKLLTME